MENIEMILKSILNQELELLRKRFKPYKKEPFIKNEIRIGIASGKKSNIAGFYENTKKDKTSHKYIHNIYLTKSTIEDYKTYCFYHMKRFAIKQLRKTIRHELIHAFVFEEFEEWEYLDNCHSDYSPIFLGCLYWANGESEHPYVKEFYNTELFKKLKKSKKYDEVCTHLLKYLISINRVVFDINRELSPNRELEVSFNLYGAGVRKDTYLKNTVIMTNNNKKIQLSRDYLKLNIGFLVDSDKLMENYKNKFDNDSLAKYHKEGKIYIKNKNKKIINEVVLISNTN